MRDPLEVAVVPGLRVAGRRQHALDGVRQAPDARVGALLAHRPGEFFQKEGLQTHAVAERETKRGTSDPTYLVYTLGKLQILKLREDYKQAKGNAHTNR